MALKKPLLAIIILIAALSRLIPHPPNFTPIIAISLFGGVYFNNWKFSVLVPLLAMILSDIVIGFHGTVIWVYSSIAVIAFSASLLKPKINYLGFITLGSSLFFFLLTNFGVWMTSSFYPKTLTGLILCYTAGLPFLQNAMIGDLMYVGILFGVFELVKLSIPKLSADII